MTLTMIKNILWIDDNPSNSLINRAYNKKKMNVVAKEYVDAGIEELLNPSVSYDAIILDANCVKHKPGSEEEKKANTTVNALSYALMRITEKHINLPWFVYSAGDFEGESSIAVIVNGYERSYDDKPYYSKPAEMEIMLDKIEEVIANSDLYKMKSKYPQICDFYSQNDIIELMVDYENISKFSGDVNIPHKVRNMLEMASGHLYKAGIIFFDVKGSDINKCSQFIGKNGGLVPSYIQRAFHSLVDYANPGSHYETIIRAAIQNGTAPFLNTQAFNELLTVLHWCASLDMSEDAVAKRFLDSRECAKNNKFKVYYFEGEVEKDDIGTIHCGPYVLDTKNIPTAESLIGKRIGVASKDENQDERTKRMYKFIVKKYVIV